MAGCCHGNQHHGRQSSGGCYCVCACASSASPACYQTPNPNVAPAMANDPLLLALVSRLLRSSPPMAPPSSGCQFFAEEIHGFQYPSQQWGRQKRDLRYPYQQIPTEENELPQEHSQSLIRSLLRRISALESSAPSVSPSPPPAENPRSSRRISKVAPPPPPRRALLRDLAARTIQTAFRRYLVQQSRTLRDLKLLASIRPRVAALRSSISKDGSIKPKVIFQKVAELIRQLESIQSADVMVQEGKKPVGRELAQLLGFAESLMAQRLEALAAATDQRINLGKEKGEMDDLRDLAEAPVEEMEESDEGSPSVRAFSADAGQMIVEGRSRSGVGDRLQREVESLFDWVAPEEEKLFDKPKVEEFIRGSRTSPAKQDGPSSSGLSAPLPLQMEPRRDGGKKTSASMK